MDLHVTLVSAPPSTQAAREIVVDTVVIPTGAVLSERLERSGLPGPFTVGGTPLHELVPHTGALVNGAVVVSGALGRSVGSQPSPQLVFVVRSGPDAGQVIPLTRGHYTIGRDAGDIVIADPALSRRHAALTVAQDRIILEDLRSANGTHVDGVPVDSAVITVAAELRLGSSTCRLEFLADQGWKGPGPPNLLEPLQVGPPMPTPPPRILLVTAFLPLLLGVILAVTTGMWFFLAFSALSAVTGTVPLLSYRRKARVFKEAVRQTAGRDAVRRTGAVPDPGQTAVDALRGCKEPTRSPVASAGTPPDLVLLRLGTAAQPAALSVKQEQDAFTPPLLVGLPFLLPCPPGRPKDKGYRFTVSGEAASVHALARSLLLQLAHPRSGYPPVVCWGSSRDVPWHSRFLPNVHLTADPHVVRTLVEETGALVVFQFSDDAPAHYPSDGVLTVRFRPGRHRDEENPVFGMVIAADSARVFLHGTAHDVAIDGVSARSFEHTARALGHAATSGHGSLLLDGQDPPPRHGARTPPRTASLWNGADQPAELGMRVGALWDSADPERPTARLGESGSGTVLLDLVKDGPHVLVAGTTGSGKSEFLRTLVLSLALQQPPELLNLVLVDYKGGSGLGVLASLPHCVGSLTDLSSESTARALTSLRAELRRRERLCSDHGAHDLDSLRRTAPSACPPRLVVVIDEFRMLSDEVPTAVPDLMKIAALGRSLGVHLVLATQRAQGAVTPDIRANITSTVVLRVQTAMESQDLLGSALAADLPVDTPGRAFLRRGTEAPTLFQVGSSSRLPEEDMSSGWEDFDLHLDAGAGAAITSAVPIDGRQHDILSAAVRELVAAAAARPQTQRPRPPILPALPRVLTSALCATFPPAITDAPARSGTVPLGVADLPDRQEQRSLHWDPAHHSHLAILGLAGSGATEAVAAAVAAFLQQDPDAHAYLLDGDGTFGGWPLSPQVGARVQAHETRRAARVLARLSNLVDRGPDAPRTVLAVTGWGRWTSQFRQGRSGGAEEDLHTLVRDGAQNGVTVVLSGDREIISARFFALVPNRVYLPLGAHPETTMTWPKLPALDAVKGRGYAQGAITGNWGDGACQLLLEPTLPLRPAHPPTQPPFAVHALPRVLPLQELESLREVERLQSPAVPCSGGLLLGVQGDDLASFRLSLAPGEAYLVLGTASSGRSNALRVLARTAEPHNGDLQVVVPPVQDAGRAGTAADFWRSAADRGVHLGPAEKCLLLVDDADRLPADVHQILSGLVGRGATAVLTAAPASSLLSRVPLALQARASGRGLVLMPRAPSEGDVFGHRLDLDGPPIKGRGFACDPAGALEVQLALVTDTPRPHTGGSFRRQEKITGFAVARSSAQ